MTRRSFKDLIDLVGEDQVKRRQNDLLGVVEDPLIEGLGREATYRVAQLFGDRILHGFLDLDEPTLDSFSHGYRLFEKE